MGLGTVRTCRFFLIGGSGRHISLSRGGFRRVGLRASGQFTTGGIPSGCGGRGGCRVTGGIAALNHRLPSGIPSGCVGEDRRGGRRHSGRFLRGGVRPPLSGVRCVGGGDAGFRPAASTLRFIPIVRCADSSRIKRRSGDQSRWSMARRAVRRRARVALATARRSARFVPTRQTRRRARVIAV